MPRSARLGNGVRGVLREHLSRHVVYEELPAPPNEPFYEENQGEEEFLTIDASGMVIEEEVVEQAKRMEESSKEDDQGRNGRPSSSVEVLYASCPPDLNFEHIKRMTNSPLNGEDIEITRNSDGVLRIRTLAISNQDQKSHYNLHETQICGVCSREIAVREIFFNFPDCLDRRRIWGSILGFQYQEILRVKHSKHITQLPICTDHFSEECYRQFNYNKAAIEALGVPKGSSPRKLPIKMKPWKCTVCSFFSFSVNETHSHMLETHGDDQELFIGNKMGVACPFCRKCTYGYRTPQGFQRHMNASPTEHGHLRKIWEQARSNCRSAYLEPLYQWNSWSEKNVCLAYYGCLPLMKPNRKRSAPSPKDNTLKVIKVHQQSSLENNPENNAQPAYPELLQENVLTDHFYSESQEQVNKAYRKIEISPQKGNRPQLTTLEEVLVNEPTGVVYEGEEVMTRPFTYTLPPLPPQTIDDEKLQRRQAAAIEARLRLFGETSSVELPTGYCQIETEDGPRLIRVHRSSKKLASFRK
ncbi:unnamed protein product, partial [Mesorhabditis belari]|uniref:THAP-type domain-containing protein n=1 Tax=Mesorhabditis belari TaxID=2138241 RepID=A0AAF3J1L8_9BILA